uniref:Uncharacterized protein n=1 Tax=Rhizophora mucronata TaxID=61149 RepID=A0A2P2IW91_RHIMU
MYKSTNFYTQAKQSMHTLDSQCTDILYGIKYVGRSELE